MEVTWSSRDLTEGAPVRPRQPVLGRSRDPCPAGHLHLINTGGLKRVIIDVVDPESIKRERSRALDMTLERDIIAEVIVALEGMTMIDNTIAVVMNIDNLRRKITLRAN